MVSYTSEQRACISTFQGPLDISAGAGSGKTFTLTQRIAHALADPTSGVDSIDNVLAITFTTKASAELKSRTRSVLRSNGMFEEALKVDSAWISTIHGMCSRVLRECACDIGIDPGFSVLSEKDAAELRERSIEEVLVSQAHQNSYQELFDAYDIRSTSSNVESLSVMVENLINAASGMLDGFDGFELGPKPPAASLLAKELLLSYEAIAPLFDGTKQSASALTSQAIIQDAIEKLNDFLLSEDQDISDFCKLIDGFKKINLNCGKAIKEDVREQRVIHSAIASKALLAYSRPLLEKLLSLTKEVSEAYQRKKHAISSLDNNDLLILVLRAFEIPSVYERYRDRFKLVMVDEFQDTDRLQIKIIEKLAGPGMRHLCTVGDAQQSIYRFRGADINVYHEYRDSLDGNQVIGKGGFPKKHSLTNNFRSHEDILAFVKRVCAQKYVFGDNFLDLKASYDGAKYLSPMPRLSAAAIMAPYREKALIRPESARCIAEYFEAMHASGHALSDMVILMRGLSHADVYAQAIREKGFPCIIAGGSVFSSAQEVQLVKSLVWALSNPKDGQSLVQVLTSDMIMLAPDDFLVLSTAYDADRNMKVKRSLYDGIRVLSSHDDLDCYSPSLRHVIHLFRKAFDRLGFDPFSVIVRDFIQDSGWMMRLEEQGAEGLAVIGNILKALRYLQQLEKDKHYGPARLAKEFEATLAVVKDSPGSLAVKGQDAVRIMTIHSSKGLEFPLVALAEFASSQSKTPYLLAESVGSKTSVSLMPSGKLFDSDGSIKDLANAYTLEDESDPYHTLGDTNNLDEYRSSIGQIKKREAQAEDQRLFYVAATRAKEALLLVMGIELQKSNPLGAYKGVYDDIRRTFFQDDVFPSEQRELEYGGTQPLLFMPIVLNPDDQLVDEVTEEKDVHQSYIIPVLSDIPTIGLVPTPNAGTGFYSYSSLSSGHELKFSEDREEHSTFGESDADKATDFGSAFHRLAQLEAIFESSAAFDHIPDIVRTYGIKDAGRLRSAFEAWVSSPEYQQTHKFAHRLPEVPFCVPLNDRFLEGEIDLLCCDDSKGKALVIDYKTGGLDSETDEALYEKHLFQAQCYAFALLSQSFNEVELHFIRVEQECKAIRYNFTETNTVRQVLSHYVKD